MGLALLLGVVHGNLFADLPLEEFVQARSAGRATPRFSLAVPGGGDLLAAGANELLQLTSNAGSEWTHDSKRALFRLASDTSLCLDAFGSHHDSGSGLGLYYCHGADNQRFLKQPRRDERDDAAELFCTALGSICVERRLAGTARRLAPEVTPVVAAPLADECAASDRPPDSDARCASWAVRGECASNPRWMREHCAAACCATRARS